MPEEVEQRDGRHAVVVLAVLAAQVWLGDDGEDEAAEDEVARVAVGKVRWDEAVRACARGSQRL